jgi:hypothetical protein
MGFLTMGSGSGADLTGTDDSSGESRGEAEGRALGLAILIRAMICVVSCRDMERAAAISSALNPLSNKDWT